MDYILGIDLGTSGAKAAILDRSGRIAGLGRREYTVVTSQPGWAEQDPAVWQEAITATTREALAQAAVPPARIAAIGLSAQMHTTVCLDAAGRVLRPAITWADQRSHAEVDEVYRRLGKATLGRWTQNPLAAGFTLATLLWLQRCEPAVYAAIAHILLPKDYLRYFLTGAIGTDATDASATSLMDVAAGAWNAELLDICNINPAILPPIHGSTEVAGHLRAEAAAALGLPEGIPVAFGAADQAAQAIGNGIISPGLLSCTIGTGGQLFAPSAAPIYDPELRLHTYCHAVPERWYIMAATLSAGLSLNWLRRQILAGGSYQALADAAAATPPGAEGLIFLPYLAGERTPHMDPGARGVFAGLTLRHDRAYLIRAVMEGVVFSLRQGLALIEDLGVPVTRVIASGGGTRHPLWLQLQADILKHGIYRSTTEEAAATGAGLLAGVAAGLYPDIATACAQAVHQAGEVVAPDPERAALYDAAFQRYVDLYPALASWNQANRGGDEPD